MTSYQSTRGITQHADTNCPKDTAGTAESGRQSLGTDSLTRHGTHKAVTLPEVNSILSCYSQTPAQQCWDFKSLATQVVSAPYVPNARFSRPIIAGTLPTGSELTQHDTPPTQMECTAVALWNMAWKDFLRDGYQGGGTAPTHWDNGLKIVASEQGNDEGSQQSHLPLFSADKISQMSELWMNARDVSNNANPNVQEVSRSPLETFDQNEESSELQAISTKKPGQDREQRLNEFRRDYFKKREEDMLLSDVDVDSVVSRSTQQSKTDQSGEVGETSGGDRASRRKQQRRGSAKLKKGKLPLRRQCRSKVMPTTRRQKAKKIDTIDQNLKYQMKLQFLWQNYLTDDKNDKRCILCTVCADYAKTTNLCYRCRTTIQGRLKNVQTRLLALERRKKEVESHLVSQ